MKPIYLLGLDRLLKVFNISCMCAMSVNEITKLAVSVLEFQ